MDSTEKGIAVQVFVLAIGIVFILSIFVILFFISYQRRLLAQQEARQKAEAEYQRDLLKATINSQEEERNRIAKELHDEIGAMLTTTKLYSSQLSPQLTAPDLLSMKDKMSDLFDDMIQNTRRISQDLRPVILEKLGLIEGIENLIDTIRSSGDLTIEFNAETIEFTDKTAELNLFRIIQELLNNTLKHAQATEIKFDLIRVQNALQLNYTDNGIGMGEVNLTHKKGIGLKNIESRVSALAGSLIFHPAKRGISIQIQLPDFYTTT